MPEILTESFCERCGTRYTFESAAPRRRTLAGMRTLSKGLRNFVLSDDTSLSEAMADARVEDDREASAQQLEAFHKTFNFCMTCRQYTCANCWNDAEGRCLTCAPHLGHEIMPAPFPDLDPGAGIVPAAAHGSVNGHDAPEAWPDVDLPEDRAIAAAAPADAIDLEVGLIGDLPEPAPVDTEGESLTPIGAVDSVVESDALAAADAVVAEPESHDAPADDALVAERPAAGPVADVDADEPELDVLAEREITPLPRIAARSAAGSRRGAGPAPAETLDDRAAAAAAQTGALLAKFRPGQSLDEAIAAYETQLAKARGVDPEALDQAAASPEQPVMSDVVAPATVEATPEPVAFEPEPVAAQPAWLPIDADEPTSAEPEPVAAQPEPVAAEPEPAAAQPEPVAAGPEPVAAEPEPVAAQPEPVAAEPEPVAAEPEPVAATAAPRRDDIVEQPAWRITAPDTPSTDAPQWPATPAWPATPSWGGNQPQARDDRAPVVPSLAGRPLMADRSMEALWAASTTEVLERPAEARTGVRPCVSCGLSLSATARFCRRCGSSQG